MDLMEAEKAQEKICPFSFAIGKNAVFCRAEDCLAWAKKYASPLGECSLIPSPEHVSEENKELIRRGTPAEYLYRK